MKVNSKKILIFCFLFAIVMSVFFFKEISTIIFTSIYLLSMLILVLYEQDRNKHLSIGEQQLRFFYKVIIIGVIFLVLQKIFNINY